MPKLWVLPVLLAATLLGTSLLGCAQTRPSRTVNIWENATFPLVVQIDVSMNQAFQADVIEAVNQWNEAIGTVVFEYEKIDIQDHIIEGQIQRPADGTILLYSMELGRVANGELVLGLTQRFYRGGYMSSCVVWLDDDLLLEETYGVMLHELGHVLGLGHDDDQASIMHLHPLMGSGDIMPDDVLYVQDQLRNQALP